MPRPNDVGVGVAALIIRDKKILLLKRKGAHAAGKWSVPRGWIDRGDDSPLATVAREVQEETGIYRAGSAELYTVTTEDHKDLNCRTVTIYYRTWGGYGEPRIMEPEKCSEMGWFCWGELPEELFPGLKDVLDYLHGDEEL